MKITDWCFKAMDNDSHACKIQINYELNKIVEDCDEQVT